SMQATDETPSRFEKARAEALKWVDSLKDTDEMVVMLAGPTTEVKQSATSEKAALRRALQGCTCSDGPTRLLPALRMAESLVRPLDPKTGPEVHLFSDGAVPELNEFENKALPLDDRLLETRPLTIPAGETSPQVFRAKQSHDGVVTVRLTTRDDLSVDN